MHGMEKRSGRRVEERETTLIIVTKASGDEREKWDQDFVAASSLTDSAVTSTARLVADARF